MGVAGALLADPGPTGDDELDAVLAEIAGDHPGQGHALVAGLDGRPHRAVEVDHRADLEEIRPQAAPAGVFRLGIGELGQAGAQQPVVDEGEVPGGTQPGAGDAVAEGVPGVRSMRPWWRRRRRS